MNGKRATIAMFFVVLLLFVFVYKRWQEPKVKEMFDRSPSHLSYSKHALCRMDCRHISKEDVEEILEDGVINLNKSDRSAMPCPKFALQGKTKDNERLRIVFAQCEGETRVVTCINLDEDYDCYCPGDPSPGSSQKKN